jgi:PST family polysaccharide transporter
MESSQASSYNQILKSTTIIGGSTVINTFLGVVRTKILAILLGPSGIGLIGVYSSITEFVGFLAALGIGSSGVRQIAEADGKGNQEKIARTIITMRRVALILGLLGTIALFAFAMPLSLITFGDTEHTVALALLSATIFLGAISASQRALLQGLRRIPDLAMLTILSAVFATVLSIPIIYFWRQKGIVPFFIVLASTGTLASWWYARKVEIMKIRVPWREVWRESKGLLSLGLVFMSAGVMAAGAEYLIRVIIVRYLSLDAAGLYQAAATLATLYIGIILNSMGTDFYPRLTAAAHDNMTCNRLVNEQTEIGLLLAGPGALFTLTFAPLMLQILYSSEFVSAFNVLQWYIVGTFLRVVLCPIRLIMPARGEGALLFWTELAFNTVQIALVWLGVLQFGLLGVGIAYFVLHIFYLLLVYYTGRRLSGFRWSGRSLHLGLISFSSVTFALILPYLMSTIWVMIIGSILTVIFGIYSLKLLYTIVGAGKITAYVQKIKIRLGIAAK